jgi:hypothetical protein
VRLTLIILAVALVLGLGAVWLQWAIAGPLHNGWFCTGRLGCWLWTKASFPAYVVAVMIADSPDGSDGFLPMAIGTFVQWFAVSLALGHLPRMIRA